MPWRDPPKLPPRAEIDRFDSAKIITRNGESYVALIDAERLDYCHRLERERIHLLPIDDARRGLADIAAGRTQDADAGIAALQARLSFLFSRLRAARATAARACVAATHAGLTSRHRRPPIRDRYRADAGAAPLPQHCP